jgi:nitrate reductase NapD
MNFSAILVTTRPDNTALMIDTLNGQSGVEVYHSDPVKGKIIAIQEAVNINEEIDGLKKIKKLPGVVLAEMMEHYFAEDESLYSETDLQALEDRFSSDLLNA